MSPKEPIQIYPRESFRESSLQIISFIWPDRNLKAHKVILAIGERHGA
jgi:hypothetical protein